MAQYSSASTILGFRPYRSARGQPTIQYFQESTCVSSQLIRRGHVVSFDTVVASASHRIVVAPSSGGTGANLLGTTNVLGVALENSTSDGSTTGLGTAGRMIGVALAEQGTEFVGYLRGDLPAVSSMVGLTRAIIWDSTRNLFNLDSTNSTAALAVCVVTGILRLGSDGAGGAVESTVGDTNGPVLFRFLSTQTAPLVGRGSAG